MTVTDLPFYIAGHDEMDLFAAAWRTQTPVMLLGPTGCGKTRLVERMAADLGRELVTVACHDDMTAADFVGRFLIAGGDVRWTDGPLTSAVRQGNICYLDEIIEARPDALAVLHSLVDHRRRLFLERSGEVLAAPEGFMLVASYNPRGRGSFKELKPSLRQRFATIVLDYLRPEQEAAVVTRETRIDPELAWRLARIAEVLREPDSPTPEPPSTRLLVAAASLAAEGIPLLDAVTTCMLTPLFHDGVVSPATEEVVRAVTSGRSQ